MRQVASAAAGITAMVQEGTGAAGDMLEAAEQKIYAIRRGRSGQGMVTVGMVLGDVMSRLAELTASGGQTLPGLSTGLSAVDNKINGLNKSDLLLLAARPGMGKTSMALNVALSAADVERGIRNALKKLSESESQPVVMDEDACAYLAESAGGDLRKALGCLDFVVTAAPVDEAGKHITLEMIQQVTRRTAMRYDRDGDDHYDIVSAYQKSMRGSDPNAALHYLARLLEAGDLPSACRRLMVCACEDVGLAYPQIIPIVKAAVDAANMVGLPEARLPLADAVILVATSPKSNSAHDAINAAIADVQAGRTGPIPRQLQNKHFDGEDAAVKGQNYKYAHDYENHWVDQQYLPDMLKDVKYYTFGDNRTEQAARAYWAKIKGEDKL